MSQNLTKGQYLRVEAARQLVDQLNESNYRFVKEAVLAIFEDLLKDYHSDSKMASTFAEEARHEYTIHHYDVGGEG